MKIPLKNIQLPETDISKLKKEIHVYYTFQDDFQEDLALLKKTLPEVSSRFGHCYFDHLNLFRISKFVLRIYNEQDSCAKVNFFLST